jgi:hypothetical protein
MERYEKLYRLYDEHDTDTLRALQDLVDPFPMVNSRVALDRWQEVSEEPAEGREEVRDAFPTSGRRSRTSPPARRGNRRSPRSTSTASTAAR